ncbi:MAG: DUF2118 domain-containing protein [Anaerolineae bacterium]|nr:DUF2118 domain-containing protein [Anaerolineae bacterium]
MKYITTVNDEKYEIEINGDVVIVNGVERKVDFKSMGKHDIYSLIIDHQSFEAVVEQRDAEHYEVLIIGDLYEVTVTDERALRLASATSNLAAPTGEVVVKSPMPGLIVDVPVKVGQQVKKGQTVVILESMKMENELKAPRDGTVHRIEVQRGASVEQNQALVYIA